jgi:type I restriction enzyme S subunit
MSQDDRQLLPSGWALACLPELISHDGVLTDGDWVESKDQDPTGEVRLTQLADIGDGEFLGRSNRFLTMEKAVALGCTFLQEGDVMVARMPDPLGRACSFRGDPRPCVTVVDVCVIRPGYGLMVSSPWLMNFINAPAFRIAIAGLQAGSTRKRISKKNLCTIPVPVPPTSEQQRIVGAIESYLTRLDDVVATLERLQRNLKRYRASVLKAAVEGRLVPTEAELARAEGRDYEPASLLLERTLAERRHNWKETAGRRRCPEPLNPDTTGLVELPEGWCWARIEQLASSNPRSIQSGPFGSNLRHSEFRNTGRLVIGIDNVQDGYFSIGANHRISEEKFVELEKYRARPGDLLVTVMATIGRCCVVPDDIEPSIITKHVYRVTSERRAIVPHYLRLAMWGGPAVRAQLFGQIQGQTRPGLNGTIIKRLAIPVPPLREQHRIVAEADRLLSIGDQATLSLAATTLRCARLRHAILKWAFEGKLADQDPNDEPASALLARIKGDRATVTTTKRNGRPARHVRKTA